MSERLTDQQLQILWGQWQPAAIEIEALRARVAKLEGDVKIIETSFTDVCDALGCPHDNEAALFAVDALRARVAKLEKAREKLHAVTILLAEIDAALKDAPQ